MVCSTWYGVRGELQLGVAPIEKSPTTSQSIPLNTTFCSICCRLAVISMSSYGPLFVCQFVGLCKCPGERMGGEGRRGRGKNCTHRNLNTIRIHCVARMPAFIKFQNDYRNSKGGKTSRSDHNLQRSYSSDRFLRMPLFSRSQLCDDVANLLSITVQYVKEHKLTASTNRNTQN